MREKKEDEKSVLAKIDQSPNNGISVNNEFEKFKDIGEASPLHMEEVKSLYIWEVSTIDGRTRRDCKHEEIITIHNMCYSDGIDMMYVDGYPVSENYIFGEGRDIEKLGLGIRTIAHNDNVVIPGFLTEEYVTPEDIRENRETEVMRSNIENALKSKQFNVVRMSMSYIGAMVSRKRNSIDLLGEIKIESRYQTGIELDKQEIEESIKDFAEQDEEFSVGLAMFAYKKWGEDLTL